MRWPLNGRKLVNSSSRRAALIYYIIEGASALAYATMFTTMTVYLVQTVMLDPLQLVLIGTVLEGSILLFEVPTGVVADTFSRRLSVIIGTLISGVGFIAMGAIPVFWAILLGNILWGFGYTFTSGATEAWLAGEVGEEQVSGVYVKSGQISRVFSLIGMPLSAVLAVLWLPLPILVGGAIIFCIGLFLLFAMPETAFKPRPRDHTLRGGLKDMGTTLQAGLAVIRCRPILAALLVVELFIGAASEGFDRLGDAHLLTNITFPAWGNLEPVAWFSILGVTGTLLGIGITALAHKRLVEAGKDPSRSARYLLVLTALSTVCVAIFAFAPGFGVAVTVLLIRGTLGSLIGPLYNSWLVQSTEPATRATVISLVGQSNALGQVVGGPGVGAIGKRFSLRAALTASALLSLPILYFYNRVAKHGSLGAIPTPAPDPMHAD